MINMVAGTVTERWQDNDPEEEEAIDAWKYLEDAVQRFRALEMVPARGEVLTTRDDDDGDDPVSICSSSLQDV